MGLFDDTRDTIFRDKSVLEEDYQPDEILERDDEITDYKHAVEDVLLGRAPDNVFLFGKAGVGKTAVTNYVLGELQAEARTRDTADEIHIAKVNCNNATVFSTVRNLINTLRDDDEPTFPKKGFSKADAFEDLYSLMDDRGGTFLLVLDEVDHLRDPDDLLYEFPRARANGHISNAHVGIIGISNNYAFRESLSPKVKSTLMEQEIAFSTYDADELATILRDRADRAFFDDVCEPAAIQYCAAVAAKDDGSARQAIDLLREAGSKAKRDRDDTVTEAHVEAIRDQVNRGQFRNRIRDQTTHAQLVLEGVARAQLADDGPVRTNRVRDAYEASAESHGHSPLTTRKSVLNHLSDLQMLGFLAKEPLNEGLSGGRTYVWSVNLDPETVIEVRESIESTPA